MQSLTKDPNGRAAIIFLFVSLVAGLFYTGTDLSVYASSLSAAVLSLAFATVHARGAVFTIGAPGLLIILLFFWSVLTAAWTEVRYVTVVEIGVVGAGACAYLVGRSYFARPFSPRWFVFLPFLGTILAAAMIAQELSGTLPRAMFINPNSAAGFLNLLWPFAVMHWLTCPNRHRGQYLLAASLFLITIAVGLDGSRGAILGACTALIVLIAASLHMQLPRIRIAASTSIVILGLLTPVMIGLIDHGSGGATAGSPPLPSLDGTSRLVIWNGALDMAQQRPWLGYGPGVFWLAYSSFRSKDDGSAGFFAHNDYLQYWIEQGLPGALLVLGIGVSCGWTYYRLLRRTTGSPLQETAAHNATAAMAGIAATGLHAAFTFSLHMMPFLIVLGMLVAMIEGNAPPRVRLSFTLPDTLRPIRFTILALLVIAVLAHSARIGVASQHTARGSFLMSQGKHAAAAAEFATSRAIWPNPDGPWYLQANANLEALRTAGEVSPSQRRRIVDQSIELLDAARERNRFRPTTSLIRGLFQSDHPELTTGSPIDSFRLALSLNPRDIEARYALSQELERAGEHSEALTVIREGLELAYGPAGNPEPLERRLAELHSRISR